MTHPTNPESLSDRVFQFMGEPCPCADQPEQDAVECHPCMLEFARQVAREARKSERERCATLMEDARLCLPMNGCQCTRRASAIRALPEEED